MQLQSDNFGRGALDVVYSSVAEKYTPARAKNAKAKVIEPFFNQFNKRYCQMQPNWSGFGVTADKENQPNSEYLNKIRKNFPDKAGAIAQIEQIISKARQDSIDQYMSYWGKVEVSEYKEMDDFEFYALFGKTTGYTNRLRGEGIVPTIEGTVRCYDSFDMSFRKLANVDWVVRYDESDLSRVMVTSKDEKYRYILEEKHVQPMALRDRRDSDGEELRRVASFNKAMKEEIVRERADNAEVLQQMMYSNPELEDPLAKLMLVDSKGRHKDNKVLNHPLPLLKKEGSAPLTQWVSDAEVEEDDEIDVGALFLSSL